MTYMKHQELLHILHFAEINGMMNHSLDDVLNEYYTTKELVEGD